ncbi:MAG: sulfatase-like hydrolase/transferase [Bacteroides sp.]|nr:sulfatase-like hydrolase/transferase [Bacteroides sp.]
MLYHKIAFVLFFITLIILCSCQSKEVSPASPNIIIILADDLGYGDLDCYGNSMGDTPNLDRMAQGGLRFTDFHSNGAVCSPTRAALLSGLYQQKVGIEAVVHATKFRHTGLSPGTFTIASYLKSSGYSTGIAGKWHLGYDTAYSPLNYGFDQFKGYVSGNVDYHSHIDGAGNYDWWAQKESIEDTGYSTDLITSYALSFIQENKDKPFFLYVAHEAPHFPYQGREDPPERSLSGSFNMNGSPENLQLTYREMISIMDEGIGDIFKALDQNSILENTLVIFLSDNGANDKGSNAPCKGYKGSLWEGAHRVPAIAYWKDRIAPGTSNELLMGMDLFPTIVALTGNSLPDHFEMDGVDFSSLLLDGKSMEEERAVFWRYKGLRSVRSGPWKFLVQEDSSYLFRLSDDPAEEINLIREYPVQADSLRKLLLDWEAEVNTYTLSTY